MPWKESSVMDERLRFSTPALETHANLFHLVQPHRQMHECDIGKLIAAMRR